MEDNNIFFKIRRLGLAILKNLTHLEDDNSEIKKFNYPPKPTQLKIIEYVLKNRNKEDFYQKDIEEALKLSKATVSDVIGRMEKNGLIERQINPNDNRSKKIILKEEAKRTFEKYIIILENLEKKACKNITNEEMKNFLNVIEKITKNLD